MAKSEQYHLEFLHKESCIVLISNVDESVSDEEIIKTYKGQQVVENSFRLLKSPQVASVIYLKSPKRIEALTMLLHVALLIRALVQYRLREGLAEHNKQNTGIPIYAGWAGKPLKNPTFKLFYEHSVNCFFERENMGEYSFYWPSTLTERRVAPLLELMGYTLEDLLG